MTTEARNVTPMGFTMASTCPSKKTTRATWNSLYIVSIPMAIKTLWAVSSIETSIASLFDALRSRSWRMSPSFTSRVLCLENIARNTVEMLNTRLVNQYMFIRMTRSDDDGGSNAG